MIAVKADVAHLSGRDKREDALHHAEAGAQNRHKRQFPPGDDARDGFAHGRLDLRLFQRKIAGGLIAHEHGDLTDELAEFLRARLFLSQVGQLVLNQRMIHHKYLVFHCVIPPRAISFHEGAGITVPRPRSS